MTEIEQHDPADTCLPRIGKVLTNELLNWEFTNEQAFRDSVATYLYNAARNFGEAVGKYDSEWQQALKDCALVGEQVKEEYVSLVTEHVDQREDLIAIIVDQASREAMFLSSEFGEEPASGTALTQPDIYWQPEARPELDETLQVRLTYPLPDGSTKVVTVERRIKSREFTSGMEGDDVTWKLLRSMVS